MASGGGRVSPGQSSCSYSAMPSTLQDSIRDCGRRATRDVKHRYIVGGLNRLIRFVAVTTSDRVRPVTSPCGPFARLKATLAHLFCQASFARKGDVAARAVQRCRPSRSVIARTMLISCRYCSARTKAAPLGNTSRRRSIHSWPTGRQREQQADAEKSSHVSLLRGEA